MSLIQTISSRRLDDLINEGARVTVTGTLAGSVTDSVLYSVPDNRFVIITGYQFSSASGSAQLISFGLRGGTPATTLDLFTGYVGGGQTIDHAYALGDARFGSLGYDVVMTIGSATTVAYTIDLRLSSSPSPLGYIEQIGTQNHANPYFGLESGAARGQSEF